MARADLVGRNVLVIGGGVTGRSVVAALVDLGVSVTITGGTPESLREFGDLARPGLTAPPEGTDLVVTTPGWKPDSPLHKAVADAGIEIIGDVELARWLSSGQTWLALTGTDGKTTTVTMLESMLLAAGVKAVACGNIGLPVLDAVRAGYEVLAVELSSYQLHWLESLDVDAAVVLNVAEDHIDWHGSMEAYAADKAKIYRGAKTRIFNADDEWSVRLSGGVGEGFTVGEPGPNRFGVTDGWLVDGDTQLCRVDEVQPPGLHNVSNALAAAALARAYGISPEAIREGLRSYQPQPHRVQLVGQIDGIPFINDSKATNTHAAAGSLMAYEHIVWIAGGELHGAEVDVLVASVADRLRGVVLMGVDQEVFAQAVERHAPEVPITRLDSRDHGAMTAAVRAARALACPGDVVLLAPAAKSFDMFEGYVHRGEVFTKAVQASA
ncbi:UDP-N-acetylmuramoyl-L-alanine--D-glutamate ligase [Kibdelosporangium philippinense]|uniref:UDP-N-acetylmuramoylalanine--D-glutamate ligase n=1 Tax=Kibdelosporangium philippinense TaxID=211113 RepID=A0ABS8ZI32_9PSEU|nr:UDP-N-acetylmuramoyl-L-alanine--D-glutamate ligase [Kibdelosporangium philippinense]MCE7007470.1 UDP-N-acetylmuramoyl-L-alanine--D-glutamate ligase [Kibdelosporangium philippinense]